MADARPDRYCRIISGEKRADVVYESDTVLAIRKRRGRAPVHVKVIPKRHIGSLLDLRPDDASLLAAMMAAVQAIAVMLNLTGFRVEMNAGTYQDTPHLHWHILGDA